MSCRAGLLPSPFINRVKAANSCAALSFTPLRLPCRYVITAAIAPQHKSHSDNAAIHHSPDIRQVRLLSSSSKDHLVSEVVAITLIITVSFLHFTVALHVLCSLLVSSMIVA
jgi:hypothetical protein